MAPSQEDKVHWPGGVRHTLGSEDCWSKSHEVVLLRFSPMVVEDTIRSSSQSLKAFLTAGCSNVVAVIVNREVGRK